MKNEQKRSDIVSAVRTLIGNTGCRIVVSLIHEMEKRNVNLGLAALCGGGGHGQAILIERV
jgi:acetyl-CoA C-acetyltransferase